MNKKFLDWLYKQPEDFVKEVEHNHPHILGDGMFSLDDLKELDQMFNPEIE